VLSPPCTRHRPRHCRLAAWLAIALAPGSTSGSCVREVEMGSPAVVMRFIGHFCLVAELLGEVEQSLRPRTSPARRRNYLGLPTLKLGQSAHRTPQPGLPMPRFYFDMVGNGVTTHDMMGLRCLAPN
jgi:hypothetical protein